MQIVADLPPTFGAPIFIVQHIGRRTSMLPAILERVGRLPVVHAADGMPIVKGRIYIAPPDRHMVIQGRRIGLNRRPLENHTRPAADPLFRSAARCYGNCAIGVVLTGGDSDGTRGLIAIKEAGGISIVQRPDDAHAPEMPRNAAEHDSPDFCPRVPEVAPLLNRVVEAMGHRCGYAPPGRAVSDRARPS